MTPKQKKVEDYVIQFWSDNGYGPSQNEIAKHMGFKYRSQAYTITTNLINQGVLEKVPGRIRSLRAVNE